MWTHLARQAGGGAARGGAGGVGLRGPGETQLEADRREIGARIAHIRRALFMPALVSVQWEPHIKAFYEHLLARGKTKMQANVAVMRKLLHAIHGMLDHDQDFIGEKFFAMNR